MNQVLCEKLLLNSKKCLFTFTCLADKPSLSTGLISAIKQAKLNIIMYFWISLWMWGLIYLYNIIFLYVNLSKILFI